MKTKEEHKQSGVGADIAFECLRCVEGAGTGRLCAAGLDCLFGTSQTPDITGLRHPSLQNCRNKARMSMKTKDRTTRLAVGLISGTSMDGIDAALVRLTGSADQPRCACWRSPHFPTLPKSSNGSWAWQPGSTSAGGSADSTSWTTLRQSGPAGMPRGSRLPGERFRHRLAWPDHLSPGQAGADSRPKGSRGLRTHSRLRNLP